MTGTLINTAAIVVGGLFGLVLKKGIKDNILDGVMKAMGLAMFIIGFDGVLTNMLTVGENGKIVENGGMLLLLCLVIGTAKGEAIDIDRKVNDLGQKIECRVKFDGFARGFVSATLVYCVGSMAILGPINDGLTGDYSLLLVKSVLDAVTALVLTSTMGIGAIFAGASVLIYQGVISLFASAVSGVLSSAANMMSDITMVGSALIICIGLNFATNAKLRTANMLPSIIVAIVYNLVLMVESL